MNELFKFSTIDLIDELMDRSEGAVIAIQPKSNDQDKEFITSFDRDHMIASLGLLKVVSTRMNIELEDSIY